MRRSLVAPLAVLTLGAGWLLPLPLALLCTVLVLAMLAFGRVMSLPFDMLPGRAGVTSRSHFAALAVDTGSALSQIGLDVAFLPDAGWRMIDAIGRIFWRHECQPPASAGMGDGGAGRRKDTAGRGAQLSRHGGRRAGSGWLPP